MCRKFSDHHRHHYYRQMRQRKRAKWMRQAYNWSYPPANVEEFDDRYELYIFAPGLEKSQFQVSVVDQVLEISAEAPAPSEEKSSRWKRQEFRQIGFKRQFELNNGIDTSQINAQYADGVLRLTLPKLEEYHTERKDILVD